MANYATLKAAIQAAIYENGNNEITGAVLQQSLMSMISSLGDGYQFMGIATPATNPGTPDQNVFYIASTAGTYANFGGLVLADGEIAILKYNGAWSKDSTGAASLEKVNQLDQEVTDVSDDVEALNGKIIPKMDINEHGFYLVDENRYAAMKYDEDGFDVAKLSAHLIQLLKSSGIGSANVVEVEEQGFFVVDMMSNIGFAVESTGIRPSALKYDYIN